MDKEEVVNNHGAQELHTWFALSDASFLTMPRVLMQEMPDEWQKKMTDLLNEYDDTFDWSNHSIGTRVQFTEDGRLIKSPEWLLNYRRPDRAMINSIKSTKPK